MTTEKLSRGAFLKLALLTLLAGPKALAAKLATGDDPGNFARIYGDEKLRDRFFLFLQNVFHLFPEDRFHQLIWDLTRQFKTDEEVYRQLLVELPAIGSVLAPLTYALPALRVQKEELTRETLELLGRKAEVDGYLEIGSPGRYLSALKEKVRLSGPLYVLTDPMPSYGPSDIMERGQLSLLGTCLPMGDYDPFAGSKVPEASLDLVNNFIGFHHCPPAKLAAFVGSIKKVLRPGGRLILRDHDVDSPEQDTLVALAHDVFNAGLFLTWKENHAQLRLFRSIRDWSAYLAAAGFKRSEKVLAQPHDPTKNLLVEFVKA